MTLPEGVHEAPTGLQRQLETWVIPPDTHTQRMQYSDRAANIFYELMHQYQDLLDVFNDQDHEVEDILIPYDSNIHEALYTIQLVTMALQDNHYRHAALALDLAEACSALDDVTLVLEASEQLHNLYHQVEKQSIFDIATWLFQQYMACICTCKTKKLVSYRHTFKCLYLALAYHLLTLPPLGGVCV